MRRAGTAGASARGCVDESGANDPGAGKLTDELANYVRRLGTRAFVDGEPLTGEA